MFVSLYTKSLKMPEISLLRVNKNACFVYKHLTFYASQNWLTGNRIQTKVRRLANAFIYLKYISIDDKLNNTITVFNNSDCCVLNIFVERR